MIRNILYILVGIFLFFSTHGLSQKADAVELHIQFYDRGVCYPMQTSHKYPGSKYLKTKSIFKSLAYHSRFYIEVISSDTADLKPKFNHELKSSSLRLNPNLDYELIIYRYEGFDITENELMTIKISKLGQDAQLILPFKKGVFNLKEMKYFKELKQDTLPNFKAVNTENEIKNRLELDSTAFYSNGAVKAEYYTLADNYPLYFVKEFDSIHKDKYAQGLRLLTSYNLNAESIYKSIWSNSDNTKYGYWEYFENDKPVKHELWASIISEKYVWFSSGKLKTKIDFGGYNKSKKYTHYLENGLIREESKKIDQTNQYRVISNLYSSDGTLIQRNTYDTFDGFTKQNLYKREVFYPSGNIKMEEILMGTYNIKNYKEDGTAKNK
ncbi:hypothetical protein [Brumimicrobium oceani]|uniref:MORN repeat variant n=1 Tax=Brumimicrobium oceani TaxID=2100725 RepID=A0A2U2XGH2_9FLAO|nr:hypothetical protein [Brumimicrobium oceani]PWH86863.1 hypothetical protein DIT68_00975 [Brumimicrobium oceani]